ncbi:metallophosphoesterase [Uliginosibacterium sediminicola]|uniref:Metallophosphoesterase n=1 Tax=Uliginosibacterium sediminicola TaxID=2024550 RepID=A0ABU9YWE9_9RHOO
MPPRKFLIVVTVLLSLLHLYLGLRLLPALPGGPLTHLLGIGWLLLSWLLLPSALLARFIPQRWLADGVAWVGMLAMGFFSSLLLLTLLRDLLLLAASLGGLSSPSLAQDSALAVIGLAALISLIGFVNARRLATVVEVEVPLKDLPAALHGFSIVQISDIHVGPTIKRNYLARIVHRVNALDADLVAITGDLVDGRVRELQAHTAPLAELRARHGSFFVTGNHEYYSNAAEWIVELRRLGLRVLLNEHVLIEHAGATLLLAGITDYSAGHFDPAQASDPQAALRGAPAALTKVLLAHQPRSAEAAASAGFDLQISGHTHGGQFFPWNYFVPLQQPWTAGLHRLRQMWVYVSRGTGYWGPPKRFGAPSEITRLRLMRA